MSKFNYKALWATPRALILSCVLLPLSLFAVFELLSWGLFHAVFQADLGACQALQGQGACWGVIAEKWNLILFGRYPVQEQWRACVLIVVLTVLMFGTVYRRVFSGRFMASAWLLFGGGALYFFAAVSTKLWGGLALTLVLSVLGFGLALPLGIVLAIGRRSKVAWVSWLCSMYIELLRALPLLTVLFLAAFVLPLVLPGGGGDLFVRVVVTVGLFSAAYLAEVVRGGLQSVPQGQPQAALALGLGAWQTQRYVVVPQALMACYPSLVNSFVTLFKECSLVTIVSLFELTGSLSLALGGDVLWRPFYLESYLFIAAIYWAYCYGLTGC